MLEEAKCLGFLGPGPVEAHLDHAAGFAEVLSRMASGRATDEEWPWRAADLGSGGGVPGLPLALHFSGWHWTLVESAARRAAFLRKAVVALGLESRVEVAEERAEAVGRSVGHRQRYDAVVARSFGPPAVVAECAAPLLRVGGHAAVSEPPGGNPHRWSADRLALLGLRADRTVLAAGWAYQLLRQVEPCPDRYPRRVGIPAKRPLF